MGVKKKGVRNWLDDIIILTRTFEEQLEILRETFDCIRQSKLSVNLTKSELCFSVVEWLGKIMDRFGIRSAPSKIQNSSYHAAVPAINGGRGTSTPRNGRLSQEVRPER